MIRYTALFFLMLLSTSFVYSQTNSNTQNTNQQSSQVAPYTLYKQGKYREAIETANKLIELDERNISAYVVQSWSYLSLSQWKNALESSLIAYRFNKSDRRIIQILGEAYYGLGRYDEAMSYFNRYLTIAPDGQLVGWVYYYVGLIYNSQDKFSKANIALSMAIEKEKQASRIPRTAWLFALAEVQETREKTSEAVDTYRYILSIDKENIQAKQALARLTT